MIARALAPAHFAVHIRIDHLLLNRELAPLLVDANVDREVRGRAGASDHAPVWIELDLPF